MRPECRSFYCHFHTRPCLTLLFHRSLFSHHFRCDPALSVFASKCQGECHAWLLFVISGILAGGIPGFCIELCCFLHPLIWPLVFLSWFSVLLLVGGHYHHDTQDVMHESPLLVAIPLLGVLLVVLFLLGLLFLFVAVFFVVGFLFVGFLLVCFCGLFCVFGFLTGIAYWTAYRSITSTFVAIDN